MSLNNMKNRINYYGGASQQERMKEDKLRGLKKALIHSYQAATAILQDGREFRCLINPNKVSLDLDNKIISIPFKDVCLNENRVGTTTQGLQDIGLKEGDTIEWKENGSHWIIYLQRLEETAYFRAEIRRCRNEIELSNGSKYWVYVRGPVEQSIVWTQANGNYANKLNNTVIMYITKNEETLNYFSRFKKIDIDNKPWEVQAVDSISTPGIIQVSLKETYTNLPETDLEQAVQNSIDKIEIEEQEGIYISGLDTVYPYDVRTYQLKNYRGNAGTWKIVNPSRKNLVKISQFSKDEVTLHIITGKSGDFSLVYVNKNEEEIAKLDIKINSL